MYAFYLIVAAISGIVECFVFATMNASLIMKHAHFLLVSSGFHLLTNILLLKLIGTSGFILANIIHMTVRIVYNWRHIKRLPNAHALDFWFAFPDMTFFTLLLVSFVITGLSGLVSC
jgi:oligosaccharide translocation protein RFT1